MMRALPIAALLALAACTPRPVYYHAPRDETVVQVSKNAASWVKRSPHG